MKWVRDTTGRFPLRPYYLEDEIDGRCELIVTEFLHEVSGTVRYPLTTDALLVLVERRVSDLDLYADLGDAHTIVDGVTDFIPGTKPVIRIARELTDQSRRENRLRTTLTHELGHVVFHDALWQPTEGRQLRLLTETAENTTAQCRREQILSAGAADWMEWQAGYASGSFLMPVTPVRQLVRAVLDRLREFSPVTPESVAGRMLIADIQAAFEVSEEASRIRLLRLGYLAATPASRPLFSL